MKKSYKHLTKLFNGVIVLESAAVWLIYALSDEDSPMFCCFMSAVIIISAAVKIIKNKKNIGDILSLCEEYRGTTAMSLIIAGICAVYTVYSLFFYRSVGYAFQGLDEMIQQLKCIGLTALGVMANSIIRSKV